MIVRAWTNFVYESTVNTCCLVFLIYLNNYLGILMSYVDERALVRVAGASQLLPLMTQSLVARTLLDLASNNSTIRRKKDAIRRAGISCSPFVGLWKCDLNFYNANRQPLMLLATTARCSYYRNQPQHPTAWIPIAGWRMNFVMITIRAYWAKLLVDAPRTATSS
jgi:hypothetical protein